MIVEEHEDQLARRKAAPAHKPSIVYGVICNFLVPVADQNMGPMFAYWACDPNFYKVGRVPAGNVNLDAEAVEAANCRDGNSHLVVSTY